MNEDGALFDSGFDDTGPFRVSPESGGVSLESALRDFGPAAIDDLIPRVRTLAARLDAAHRAGLRTASEVFADRGYAADGSLVPRDQPGAVLHEPDVVIARAISMARDGEVVSVDGRRLALDADTICVHSDTPGAARLARRLRDALDAAGLRVAAIGL